MSEPLTVTLNGEERQVRPWAYPLVFVLAAPALGVVLCAVMVMLMAVMLALPAMAVSWLLSAPGPVLDRAETHDSEPGGEAPPKPDDAAGRGTDG